MSTIVLIILPTQIMRIDIVTNYIERTGVMLNTLDCTSMKR